MLWPVLLQRIVDQVAACGFAPSVIAIAAGTLAAGSVLHRTETSCPA